jgi:hypothetical protein
MFVNSPSLSFPEFLCDEALKVAKERDIAGFSEGNHD